MRLLFWRKRGRHALGAAVTALPSGPVAAAPALPPVAPEPAAAEPDLMSSIATLIATGEAWAAPGELAVAAGRPVGAPAPTEPAAQAAPVLEAPTPQFVVVAAQPIAPAVPPQPEPVPAALPRVQLGFRDGTSTSLDPASQQSIALEQIARSLTRRD